MRELPNPNDEAFAVTPADLAPSQVNTSHWRTFGAWNFREFGHEAQLRNPALPWLSLDLFRSEVEDLYAALGRILSRPAPVPFRLSRWERVKQWWQRAVWNRKHHAELKAAREHLVEHYTRKGPWAT